MRKMICRLMAMCFLSLSLAAFAQTTDTSKQDSMKHDDMKQDQMNKEKIQQAHSVLTNGWRARLR